MSQTKTATATKTQTGEKYKQCPVTGQWHLVTEWVEKPDDRIVAIEKEPVDEDVVPEGER